MIIVLVVVIAWSVLWFTAATVVDRHAERAEHIALDRGAMAHCLNRSVTGFPFRIEVRCDRGSRIGTGDAMVKVEGLTAAALIYRPRRLIVEAEGPAVIAANGFSTVTADWQLAHASARVDLSEMALERFDIEVRDGEITVGARPPLGFDEVDVNARENPQNARDLDVAVRIDEVLPQPGMDAASLSLRGTLAEGAPLLAGRAGATLGTLLSDGLTLVLDAATFTSGNMLVAAGGTLTLGADGRLNGDVEVAIAGYEDRVPYVAVVAPEAEKTISMLLDNVLSFAPETTVDGRTAKKLSISVRDGRARAGIVPLFTIPPLPLAGH